MRHAKGLAESSDEEDGDVKKKPVEQKKGAQGQQQ
jgi:hypothetical protein